jgi:lysyl-tRNA synthetase class 2
LNNKLPWKTKLSWSRAKLRAEYVANIRNFFFNRDVIEVETPLLTLGTITDVYIDTFSTQYSFLRNTAQMNNELYLQTSPEFAMKKLLASGYGSIFQICKAFRNEAAGRHHNPEFTMLEWYRLGFDCFELMDEVDDLLQLLLKTNKSTRLSYQNAFLQYLNVDPLKTTHQELKNTLKKQNVEGDWIDEEQDLDILLQVLFSECIEPSIGKLAPCFIYDYPKSQASLAKISCVDERVAQRFECFYLGIELANGFNELTDAGEQKLRFEQDNKKRAQLGKEQKPIDEEFIQALAEGLPQCSGVALGLDRLFMLAMKQDNIHPTMTYSLKEN